MPRAYRPDALLSGPFTVEAARAAGVSARQLQSVGWRSVFRGVYVDNEIPDTVELRARAVKLVLPPDAVVGYESAAWLSGVDIRRRGDLALDVIAQRGDQIRRRGVRPTSALVDPDEDVIEIAGVPCTTPVRTTFDLARRRDLIEAVVGVDAMLHRGWCTAADVAAYASARPGWRGVRWALETLHHSEPLAQSPMESRQRMRLVLSGLPRPRAQVPVHEPGRDRPFAYIDNGYDEWRVGTDYDGDDHSATWRQDLERQERIRDQDWWHRRYTSLHIMHGWRQMVQQVWKALVAAGWRPPAAAPAADHAHFNLQVTPGRLKRA